VPNILDELELFNRIFTALYRRQQADAIALLAGLERRRRQYNLLPQQDLFYILSEVYPRAIQYRARQFDSQSSCVHPALEFAGDSGKLSCQWSIARSLPID
jgi:hypothetical protein